MEDIYGTKYTMKWDSITRTVHILDSVKVAHFNELKYWLLTHGYYYKNIIIGRKNDRKLTEDYQLVMGSR